MLCGQLHMSSVLARSCKQLTQSNLLANETNTQYVVLILTSPWLLLLWLGTTLRYPGRLDSTGPGPTDPALSAALPDGMLNAAGMQTTTSSKGH